MRACARCGNNLPARSRARFCSAECRQAGYRARKAGRSESIGEVVDFRVSPAVEWSVSAATRAELDAAGRLNTHLGQAALALAERIDNATAVMGFAALVKELRETMIEAVKDAEQSHDALDEIQQAALRLLHGTG